MIEIGQEMSFMSVNVFLDTNILVYTIDERFFDKQQKARQLLRKLQSDVGFNPVISTQVLQEFFMVTTKKLKQDKNAMHKVVYELSQMQVVNSDTKLVLFAIQIAIKYHLTLWDALMIGAAKRVNCEIMYSEDLNDGQIIEGVKIVNPFLNEF